MPVPAPSKAYAVLAGGGVKGAALAGCLKAAEDAGIEFVGYGGTSAGALVATLAAIGFTPAELRKLLVETPFASIVAPDGDGARLRALMGIVKPPIKKRKLPGIMSRVVRHLPLLSETYTRCGVLRGTPLLDFLQHRMAEKGVPADARFSQLGPLIGGKQLKVMCTDLTLRKAVEFGSDREGRDPQVAHAVRASCGYPFVFEPQPDQVEWTAPDGSSKQKHTHQLADGGLTSNLPVSLFAAESARTGFPIIAFDLVQESSPHEGPYEMGRLVQDLLASALGSGDHMARRLVPNVIHVPVIIPPRINTFDIDLGPADAEELFACGLRDARLKLGEPKLRTIEQLLAALVEEIGTRWPQSGSLRASLMAPDSAEVLEVRHHHAMTGAPDLELKLAKGTGVAGTAWVTRRAIALDPTSGLSGLTPGQLALIPTDRQAMVSFPVTPADAPDGEPVAVLTVDSSTPLTKSKWLENAGKDISDLGAKWARQAALMLE